MRDGRKALDRRELPVGGGQEEVPQLAPDLSPKTVEGTKVALSGPQVVKAGQSTELTFVLTRRGQPVSDLKPYLGAAAHVAIVSAERGDFTHTHGEAAGGGQGEHSEGESEAGGAHASGSPLGPQISFHHTFPERGLYKVWGQFQTSEGEVITADFVVRAK